jgi:hypothetical protein
MFAPIEQSYTHELERNTIWVHMREKKKNGLQRLNLWVCLKSNGEHQDMIYWWSFSIFRKLKEMK